MARYSEMARVLLDRVQYGKSELTIDAADMSDEAVTALKSEAATRGMHVSGTRRWILVRQLEALGAPRCTRRATSLIQATDDRHRVKRAWHGTSRGREAWQSIQSSK